MPQDPSLIAFIREDYKWRGEVSRILNLPQYHLLLPCDRTCSYVQLSDIPSGRFPESIGQITPEDDLHDAVFATMSFVERINKYTSVIISEHLVFPPISENQH